MPVKRTPHSAVTVTKPWYTSMTLDQEPPGPAFSSRNLRIWTPSAPAPPPTRHTGPRRARERGGLVRLERQARVRVLLARVRVDEEQRVVLGNDRLVVRGDVLQRGVEDRARDEARLYAQQPGQLGQLGLARHADDRVADRAAGEGHELRRG